MCPVETVTLSTGEGTSFASHVKGFVQIPEVIEINVPGNCDVKEILSKATGGFTPPPPSFFQAKIKRKVVPARFAGRKTVAL